MEFKKLSLIQKNNTLNDLYVDDVIGPGNGRHYYRVVPKGHNPIETENGSPARILGEIQFQFGPRNVDGSICGVLDNELLEIVRHRLQCFQAGQYATRENAIALTHIEEALLWMNKRADDRAERNVLGTMEK